MAIDEFGDVERVLVVAPHPDDAEIGCGGTVALLAREGVEVHYLIATNGDKGTEDPTLTNADLAATRDKEQRDAAAMLGVKEVTIPPEWRRGIGGRSGAVGRDYSACAAYPPGYCSDDGSFPHEFLYSSRSSHHGHGDDGRRVSVRTGSAALP